MNLLGSNHSPNSSTGRVAVDSLCTDSVKIAYCDLKTVNAKLIELDYEKINNGHLRDVVYNDSIVISGLKTSLFTMVLDHDKEVKQLKKEKAILGGATITTIILLLLSIL